MLLKTGPFLLGIPVEQADFDPGPFQRFLEHCEVGSAVMIWNHDLRVKGFDRVSSLVRWHGVGKIHAHESHIDVLERTHLWYSLGVVRIVDALTAISETLAIVTSLVMEELVMCGVL